MQLLADSAMNPKKTTKTKKKKKKKLLMLVEAEGEGEGEPRQRQPLQSRRQSGMEVDGGLAAHKAFLLRRNLLAAPEQGRAGSPCAGDGLDINVAASSPPQPQPQPPATLPEACANERTIAIVQGAPAPAPAPAHPNQNRLRGPSARARREAATAPSPAPVSPRARTPLPETHGDTCILELQLMQLQHDARERCHVRHRQLSIENERLAARRIDAAQSGEATDLVKAMCGALEAMGGVAAGPEVFETVGAASQFVQRCVEARVAQARASTQKALRLHPHGALTMLPPLVQSMLETSARMCQLLDTNSS